MTTIESKEIRGITLRILYLLVTFSVVSTFGIMSSYFSLKNDNQLLATQIEILKIQVKTIDQRLEKIEIKSSIGRPVQQSVRSASGDKNLFYYTLVSQTGGLSAGLR